LQNELILSVLSPSNELNLTNGGTLSSVRARDACVEAGAGGTATDSRRSSAAATNLAHRQPNRGFVQTLRTRGKSPAIRELVSRMQGVDIDIELIRGEENSVADAVSRFRRFSEPEVNVLTPSSPPSTPPHPPTLSTPEQLATPPMLPHTYQRPPPQWRVAHQQSSTVTDENDEDDEDDEVEMAKRRTARRRARRRR
jgi:hypothetical protein